MRRGFVYTVALAVSGCSSAFTAITDRAIVAEKLNRPTDQHKAIAVAGDRRLVRFTKLQTTNEKDGWLICAEPFAGAVSARAASSALQAAANGKASDSFTETALAVDQRSSADRIYQDSAHDICLARAAGIINDSAYWDQLKVLQTAAFAAAMPTPVPTPKATSTPDADDVQKCLAKAGTDEAKKAACKKPAT